MTRRSNTITEAKYLWPTVASSLRGSAILPLLVLVLLLTILLSTVIFYGAYHRTMAVRYMRRLQARYLAESALQLGLRAMTQSAPVLTFPLRGTEMVDGVGTCEFQIAPFGLYLLCQAQGTAGGQTHTLRGLLGRSSGDEWATAINLGGGNYPLVLAGDTHIMGDVIVGPAAVIAGKFEGRNFNGSQLVAGDIISDRTNRMPRCDSAMTVAALGSMDRDPRMEFEMVFDQQMILSDENITEANGHQNILFRAGLTVALDTSLLDITGRHWFVQGDLVIRGKSRLFGFGRLETQRNLSITDDAELRDILITCHGDAQMRDRTLFKGQLICSNEISVDDSARLEWPAILAADATDGIGSISCQSRADLWGSAVVFGADSLVYGRHQDQSIPGITIASSRLWRGLIYSQGYCTIRGQVQGNISTQAFYLYAEPTAYINWLVDARISADSGLAGLAMPYLLGDGTTFAYAYYY